MWPKKTVLCSTSYICRNFQDNPNIDFEVWLERFFKENPPKSGLSLSLSCSCTRGVPYQSCPLCFSHKISLFLLFSFTPIYIHEDSFPPWVGSSARLILLNNSTQVAPNVNAKSVWNVAGETLWQSNKRLKREVTKSRELCILQFKGFPSLHLYRLSWLGLQAEVCIICAARLTSRAKFVVVECAC